MNWAQLTLKQVEKRSEVITSYKTNVNYIWFNRYISASNQPWHASAGSPMGFLGEFSGDASLVRSDGWSDWAECTRATKRWSAAGFTASWPFGNNSPISYLPIPSTVPEKVKLNNEIKVTITIIVVSGVSFDERLPWPCWGPWGSLGWATWRSPRLVSWRRSRLPTRLLLELEVNQLVIWIALLALSHLGQKRTLKSERIWR